MYFPKSNETFHWNGNKSEHVSHSHAMPFSMLSYIYIPLFNVQCPTSKLKELLHLLNRLMKRRKTITCTSVIINKILCTGNVLCVCYHLADVFVHHFWFLHIFLLIQLELLTVRCSICYYHIWIGILWKIHTEYCILF